MIARPTIGALLLAAGLAACGDDAPALPPVGAPPPAFTARTIDGRPVAMPDAARGRGALVTFWASWCAPCRVELPILAEFQRRHPDLPVLAVNAGEDGAVIRGFAASTGLDLPLIIDDGGAITRAYGVAALPVTVLVGGDGRVTRRILGAVDADMLEREVRPAR